MIDPLSSQANGSIGISLVDGLDLPWKPRATDWRGTGIWIDGIAQDRAQVQAARRHAVRADHRQRLGRQGRRGATLIRPRAEMPRATTPRR